MALRLTTQLLPFLRIGGRSMYALPNITVCQTDASFRARPKQVHISALIHKHDKTRVERLQQLVSPTNSTEAEWAGVLFGLRLCIEENHSIIGIENDNLSVITQLLFRENMPKQVYARHYREKIYALARETTWTGVRWIPRELNQADEILRR